MLNPDGIHYVQMVDELGLERQQVRYSFVDHEDYLAKMSEDLSEGMRIYWTEMLQRAYLATVTSILRSRRWLKGVQRAEADGNFLVFAGTLRGLMESGADASTALVGTPLSLAQCRPSICEALASKAETVCVSSEIEDELIHYSHGRRLKGRERANAPRSYEARPVQQYFEIFGDVKAVEMRSCYTELCDLTHPGASSVGMWLVPENPTGLDFSLAARRDAELIADFLQRHRSVLLDLLMFAFNMPAITLKVLNHFPIGVLHTPKLSSWNLDGIPVWIKCHDALMVGDIRPIA